MERAVATASSQLSIESGGDRLPLNIYAWAAPLPHVGRVRVHVREATCIMKGNPDYCKKMIS